MAQQRPSSEPPLSDRLLRSWLRCRRKGWLDRHGNSADRQWNPHRALQLADREVRLQALVSLPLEKATGMAALQAGAPEVRLLLLRRGSLRGRPTLLLRTSESSLLGGFSYQPALLQPGRHGTREHRLTLSYWSLLLEPLLGECPSQGLLINPRGQRERVRLGGNLPRQRDQALTRLQQDLRRREPPPLTQDRRKCALCSWRAGCDAVAEDQGELSQVSGIGAKRQEMLQELGIADRAALAASAPAWLVQQLEEQGEQRPELALELIAQARVQESGMAEALADEPADPLPELQRAQGVLLYDIESDPDARDDFLHGFVPLRRCSDGRFEPAETARYLPLLALKDHGEARLWQRLQRLLAAHPGWPVLHYGETEVIALRRLAERQGDEPPQGLIDLHRRVRQHWRLPVSSYGLKAVASWRGFHWSQPAAEGARCVLWWRQWRAQRQRHLLQEIFRYNRDDCLATWAVAQWLSNSAASGSESSSPAMDV